MIQRIFDWIRALAAKVKEAVVKLSLTVWTFLKKWGWQIVNFIVLLIAYDSLYGTFLAEALVGLWVFALAVYYIFWKLFGAERVFRDEE